jgi:hypothetical protein
MLYEYVYLRVHIIFDRIMISMKARAEILLLSKWCELLCFVVCLCEFVDHSGRAV